MEWHVVHPCPCNSSSNIPHLLDMSTAAPPMRNKQLVMSMFFSLPRYMQAVTFSWLMTSARLLGSACIDAHKLTTQAWRSWAGFRGEAGAGAQPLLQSEPCRWDKHKDTSSQQLAGRSGSKDTKSFPQQAAPCKRGAGIPAYQVTGSCLQEMLGQVDRDQGRGAAHAAQVVGQRALPHVKVIDHHGRQRGRGVEARARHYYDVHLHSGAECGCAARALCGK